MPRIKRYLDIDVLTAARAGRDDAGHAANIHQPEAFNGAVVEFLKSCGI